MAADNSEVLDIAKENIQPLRHGRKAAQLKTALQAQADPDVYQQLMKQREKFEYLIRMYEGDDPLEPYYNYILWLEQSFPSAGRDNNVPLLLEDTLLKFKDCEKYRQDARLAQLIVKYINIQPNSLELYQLVYNLGLTTMCSSLYKAWAEELQKARDFKRADQVFQLGLQCRAQPVQELQDAHVQFQLSIARKLLEENVNPLATSATKESSRAVLTKLQPSKVKSSRASKESAGVFTSSKSAQTTKSSNFGSTKFQVYQEDTNDGQLKSKVKSETEVLPRGSSANRENHMSASKWCGQKAKQLYKTSSTNSAPTFDIHEDPEAACDNVKTVIRPCALRTRKEEFKCPVAIFGPPNPNQLPMYPKQLVYVGGRDMQLEEIRAAYYWKKIEKQEQINSVPESVSAKSESKSCFENLSSQQPPSWKLFAEKQSCNEHSRENAASNEFSKRVPAHDGHYDDIKARRSDRRTKLFQNDSQPTSESDMLITPARPTTPIDVYLDDPRTRDYSSKSDFEYRKNTSTVPASRVNIFPRENASSSAKSTAERESVTKISDGKDFEFLKPNLSSKTKSDVFVDDDCFSNKGCKQMDDFDFISAGGLESGSHYRKSEVPVNFANVERENVNFNHSLCTSMTVNTKAAMSVIQQMWESPLTQRDTFDTFETMDKKAPAPSNKCLFPVYCDDDDPSARKNEPVTANKISFEVFCDDTFPQPNDRYSTKSGAQAGKFSSKSKSELPKSSNPSKKASETERRFGTPLPLIVPVKLQDSPVKPENKENRFPNEYVDDHQNHHEDSHEEEHFNTGRDCEIDDDTCNTRVFAVALPSSTPRTLREKSATSRKSVYEESYSSLGDDYSICYPKSTYKSNLLHNTSECHKRGNKTGSDLSLILENSKEQGSGSSSSSSGNAGSKLYLS